MSKHNNRMNRRRKNRGATYTNANSGVPFGDRHISLRGFNQQQLPDCTLIKMTYSDYRTITSAGSQGNYIYKFNSLFDPDFTGVGGQPDGFDQWKALYLQYRVVACDVTVTCAPLAGAALCCINPSSSSTAILSAEECAGLRKAKAGVATASGKPIILRARYRPSDVFGVPDSSVLDNDNYASSITGSPSSAAYLQVSTETSGATDAVMIWTKLVMYSRFEKPVDTVDSIARRTGSHPAADAHAGLSQQLSSIQATITALSSTRK
jgi:hypothetical protein